MPEFVSVKSNTKVPNVKNPFLHKIDAISNRVNPWKYKFASSPFQNMRQINKQTPIKMPVPGEGLPRIIHYCADQSGCAFWRMIWPGDELLAQNKAVIMSLYQMVVNAQFYLGIDAIRLQRQCTAEQVEFIKFLRQVTDEFKKNKKIDKSFRLIWEVDDIVFPKEDIPDYNICKDGFLDDGVGDRLREITKYVDEIVVVSEEMRKHYKKHLGGFDKISVIPNYAPKYWLDRGVTEYDVVDNLRKHKKKPRIVYAGSGTHFDVGNRVNQFDDFGHVVDLIIADLVGPKKYEWVFSGGLPLKLRQFIGKGVEFTQWSPITEYPELLKSLKGNVMIAPLADNTFSRAKANIKLVEGGMLGMPVVAQNLPCYNSDGYQYLFNTGEEMFKQIEKILLSVNTFRTAVRHAKEYAEKHLLKDHIDEWLLLYTTEYGSNERRKNNHFVRNNNEQLPPIVIEGEFFHTPEKTHSGRIY